MNPKTRFNESKCGAIPLYLLPLLPPRGGEDRGEEAVPHEPAPPTQAREPPANLSRDGSATLEPRCIGISAIHKPHDPTADPVLLVASFRITYTLRRMKQSVLTFLAVGVAVHFTAEAAPGGRPDASGSEATTSISYTAPSSIAIGTAALGDVSTVNSQLQYTFRWGGETHSWRAGLEWDRTGFGLPSGAPLPNTLHALSLNLGHTWQMNDQWSLRTDLRPGVYSDLEDVDGGDFNVPFTVGVSYRQSDTLTWVAAASVDARRDVPVFGGVGVRWQFAENWTLSLILPRPAIEYRASEQVTVFAGGELVGGAYRVAEDLGSRTGRPELNDQMLSYREIRVGAGMRARIAENVRLVAQAGWAIDRRFVFDEANLLINGKGAAYVSAGLSASF